MQTRVSPAEESDRVRPLLVKRYRQIIILRDHFTTHIHRTRELTENLWQQLSLENPVYGLHPLPALGLRLRAELVGALRRVQDKAAAELPA